MIFRGQAEKEFRVEVEAIGHVRHKNLVRLLGYCVEGTQRYLYCPCHIPSIPLINFGYYQAKFFFLTFSRNFKYLF
jgi:hypothetical protein